MSLIGSVGEAARAPCPRCDGTGRAPAASVVWRGERFRCGLCGGSGRYVDSKEARQEAGLALARGAGK